jgi:hypothetical protein
MKKIIGIFAICGVLQSNAAQVENDLPNHPKVENQSKTEIQSTLLEDLEVFFNYDVTCVYRRRTYLYGEVEVTVSCMACSVDPAEASRNAAQCVADKATVALEKID